MVNKCRVPKIPTLLVNNLLLLISSVKARYFNDFFSKQRTPIINNDVLPAPSLLTNKRIGHVNIEKEEIISLVRNINPNKATGSDGISDQMLLLCDGSVSLPLQMIFRNILSRSIYPDISKLANALPIFRKGGKQLIKNYRPISLLPICGKILEKIIFTHLYSYLHTNNLISKNLFSYRRFDN